MVAPRLTCKWSERNWGDKRRHCAFWWPRSTWMNVRARVCLHCTSALKLSNVTLNRLLISKLIEMLKGHKNTDYQDEKERGSSVREQRNPRYDPPERLVVPSSTKMNKLTRRWTKFTEIWPKFLQRDGKHPSSDMGLYLNAYLSLSLFLSLSPFLHFCPQPICFKKIKKVYLQK